MPKKRKSDESKNDGQTTGGSESLSQEEDNTKREKLDLLSDTTLQDLPMELLECILVKVVATEVMGMKLTKAVWKEKADLVIIRLTSVCSQWGDILSTKSFQIKLHRILDGTGQKFRFKIVTKSKIPFTTRAVTSLGDETFLLDEYCLDIDADYYFIDVCSSNTLEVVKRVLSLPEGKYPTLVAGCVMSNCVYVALDEKKPESLSILRISKDAEHQYSISPWESDHKRPVSMLSVTANGSLMILDMHNNAISIYNGNGSLQREVKLPPVLHVHKYVNLLQKSNGNVVLAYISDENYLTRLLEIDMSGIVVRQFESAYNQESSVNFADIHDRIMISQPFEKIELLDSEFNLIGYYSQPEDVGKKFYFVHQHFDSVENVVVRIRYDWNAVTSVLTKYRLIEE